jgi:death-on-curing protein
MDWIWIPLEVVLAIHEDQLAQYGGAGGVRDEGLLQSALARPQNLAAYGDPDAAALGTGYAFGVVRNHPFVDGNKRTGFALLELFLARNGWRLTADDMACIQAMTALAASQLSESEFEEWVRAHLQERR